MSLQGCAGTCREPVSRSNPPQARKRSLPEHDHCRWSFPQRHCSHSRRRLLRRLWRCAMTPDTPFAHSRRGVLRHLWRRAMTGNSVPNSPDYLLTPTPIGCIMRTRSSQSAMSFAPPVTFGLRVSRSGKAPGTRNTQHRTPSGNRRHGD